MADTKRNLTLALEGEDAITVQEVAKIKLVPKTQEVIDFEAINGEIPESGSAYTDTFNNGANSDATIFPDGKVKNINDNAEYTRYSDGSVVITYKNELNITIAGDSSSPNTVLTFPIELVRVKNIQSSGHRNTTAPYILSACTYLSSTSVTVSLENTVSSSRDNCQIDITIEGEYK